MAMFFMPLIDFLEFIPGLVWKSIPTSLNCTDQSCPNTSLDYFV
jgi:hypothetical protein